MSQAISPRSRPETASDHEAVRHVNRLAFGQEDEAKLVDALREGGYARVSLVAELDGQVVGHILFSELQILTNHGSLTALSLAPMAVLPDFQKCGIGSELVRYGMLACRDAGHRIVIVLGHSHFYPRFGFSAKLAEPLSSPFAGGESWMAAELVPGALDGVSGWVQYPPPFGVAEPARSLSLQILDGTFAVCKLPSGSAIPSWTTTDNVFSITRTPDELSIVCRDDAVPDEVQCEHDWRCLRVAGAMPFALVGVLASLTAPLAAAGIGVFAISTFDTDYLLVKAADFESALAALRTAGHTVTQAT